MRKLHTVPKVNTTTTSGAVEATAVSYDLSDATEQLGVWDNCQICVEAIILGRTAAGLNVTLRRNATFERTAGTLSAALSLSTPGTDYQNVALVATSCTIDSSGNTIRVRPTGVVGQDIVWVAYMWLYSSELP